MGVLETLLSVQEHDTVLTQLRHRRANLPEQQALDACLARLAALEAGLAGVRAEAQRMGAREEELETSLRQVDEKIASAGRQLYSGSVTATRELQALEADIASLKKHRGDLEDHEIEVLMEREPVDASLAAAAVKRAAIDAEASQLRLAIVEASVVIDADLTRHVADREAVVGDVPADLLALYESVRKANGGVGIARLEHGTCMACRLKLSAMELDRIRHQPAEAVIRCEECSAILVP